MTEEWVSQPWSENLLLTVDENEHWDPHWSMWREEKDSGLHKINWTYISQSFSQSSGDFGKNKAEKNVRG